MSDHYELFGVDPDASKDEIKAAYRSEVESADSARRAQLNRAWNVLSDPIQRQRYDEQIASDDGGVGDDDGGVEVVGDSGGSQVPARRATGARRGPSSKILKAEAASATNGAAKNGLANGAKGRDAEKDARPVGRQPLEPTIMLPEGMHLPSKKARGLSILFDLAIVIIFVLGCQFLVPGLVSSDYDHYRDIANHQLDVADKAGTREDKANDRADAAGADASKAKKAADSSAEQDARDREATAKVDAKNAAADKKAAQKAGDKATSKTQGPLAISSAVAFILSMLYLVPMTALTGQTVGKRLNKLWLVKVDGTHVTWGRAISHFGVPIAIGIAIPQLGPIVALGMVFWALRDRNEQGLHDKLSKTVVVDSPPASMMKELA
jgi:curved DNA-binding protein CbpA